MENKSGFETFLLDNGVFIFKLADVEDKRRVLDEGPWNVGRKPLFLRQWNRYLQPHRLDLSSLPLWVSLLGLPLHFWCEEGLSVIGSVLGNPLYSDGRTKLQDRLAFAKICVEVSADAPLPASILVVDDEGFSFNQAVHYEWTPPQCLSCKLFGHSIEKCPAAGRGASAKDPSAGAVSSVPPSSSENPIHALDLCPSGTSAEVPGSIIIPPAVTVCSHNVVDGEGTESTVVPVVTGVACPIIAAPVLLVATGVDVPASSPLAAALPTLHRGQGRGSRRRPRRKGLPASPSPRRPSLSALVDPPATAGSTETEQVLCDDVASSLEALTSSLPAGHVAPVESAIPSVSIESVAPLQISPLPLGISAFLKSLPKGFLSPRPSLSSISPPTDVVPLPIDVVPRAIDVVPTVMDSSLNSDSRISNLCGQPIDPG
ncbi:uncharacterized protein LOC122663097 [Telopea speciosissima]|uniref:uncharacterized protein LOC122663097 n=1 Tax=Telopea speciosissima TaxID=54955 RepID=UPI001CC721C3|nr:uncharacterized protein LOC122663097 [Telopea speciosissima]